MSVRYIHLRKKIFHRHVSLKTFPGELKTIHLIALIFFAFLLNRIEFRLIFYNLFVKKKKMLIVASLSKY